MKKLSLTLFLVLAASIGTMRAAIIDGECGKNLTYELNTKDSTLTIIGTGAMDNWPYDQGKYAPWHERRERIKRIILPEGLTTLGDWSMGNCPNLVEINLPSTLVRIGYSALENNEQLSSIVIPDNVKTIGAGAFGRCTGLTSITIGNNVDTIGDWAFYACHLSSITIPESVRYIGSAAFLQCWLTEPLIIPDGVDTIGPSAFAECGYLESVEVGNGVKIINEGTFNKCWALKTVKLGTGVQCIRNDAFCYTVVNKMTVLAAVPPTIEGRLCCDYENCDLYVPAGSVTAYDNALVWEDFNSINPLVSIKYEVVFLDYDGTEIDSQFVPAGHAAVAPAAPSRPGYTFVGWDADFSAVNDDMEVHALYELGQDMRFAVSFVEGVNGSEVLVDSVTVKVPAAPEIAGFTFLRWEIVAGLLEDGFQVLAVYESDTPTAAPEVINPANPSQKLIRQGNVYILRDDRTYTLKGQIVGKE